jgi:hemerythrin-like domain-containing protein
MQDRIDLYRYAHKGARYLLSQVAMQLGRADFGDPQERNTALDAVKAAIDLLRMHSHSEDSIIHCEAEKRVQGCSQALSQEHKNDEYLLRELETQVDRLLQSPAMSTDEGFDLYRKFNKYLGHYLLHLDREENEMMPILWKHFSDQELQQLRAHMLAKIPPEYGPRWAHVMLPAFSSKELLDVFRTWQMVLPAERFEQYVQLARTTLADERWQVIAQQLGLPASS